MMYRKNDLTKVLRRVAPHVVLMIQISIWALPHAPAQADEKRVNYLEEYRHEHVMIPMRDGINLYTNIYRPKNMSGDLPILLVRTPYNSTMKTDNRYGIGLSDLARDGYIFVWQDIRGKFASEGEFVMLRPPSANGAGVDESTDVYDTIDWLVNNVPGNNGRVGVWGISYMGWTAAMSLRHPHPALKVVSLQGAPSDMYWGDDFLHNGVLRLAPLFGYAALAELTKTLTPFPFDKADVYEWFLDLDGLVEINEKYFKERSPTWNAAVQKDGYSDYWLERELTQYLDDVSVPVLHVAGWFDAEDFYGPLKIYSRMEHKDDDRINNIVVGPWFHGGWIPEADKLDAVSQLGDIEFGSDTESHFLKSVFSPFFSYHLKGQGNPPETEAIVFETGSNQWREFEAWPPVNQTTEKRFYLHPGGKLSTLRPKQAENVGRDSYTANPARPVPYTPRPMTGFWQSFSAKAAWKTSDQRFASARPDVLTYVTEPLANDVVLAGATEVELFVSSTGTDADFVVKLIDVHPEQDEKSPEAKPLPGYQMLLTHEVFPTRFRNSFEKGEPLPPNQPVRLKFQLADRLHRFRRGHKIMVQIQSSMFPLFATNPQQFVETYEEANRSLYTVAEHSIYRSAERPTSITLPVLGEEVMGSE